MYSNLEVLNTIATNLNLNVPVVQLNAGPDLQNKFTANNMPLECNLHVQVAQNSSTELQNESTSNNMLPECYLHVPIVHNSSIEIQNNSTSNDVISEGNLHVQVTQNSSTELQNESTSNMLPECHLHVPIVHNSSMEIQNNSTSNDVISECNLHIQVIQNSSMEIQNDPTSNEVLSKGNVHVPVVQNASKELPNDSILNDMLSECNIHVPVIQNASTELQNDSTSNDMLSECNIYVPVLQNASLDLENEFTSNDMLSECSLNVSTIRNVSTELENESASNNMLSECNLYVPVIQNVNTELQNESVSNDILSECNLHQDILNPSETSIDNFTLNTNFDQTVTILFDELNDLGISPNNMLNYSNEDENNVSKNLNQSCNVDNSMEIENNRNEANHEKAMNDIDVAKLIKESNNNLKQVNDISNLNNSDCSDCYSDKDPDYHYSTDSENSEVEDDAQHCSIQSTNTTNSSLETSLNASRQQICDDANLHVECSKPKGQEKKNFCFYCKKMQAKISRHLERVHKNEEEVKKFTGLPKGNKERQKIIGLLRRRGNYLYNTDPTYNKGELIVCRRPTESRKKAAHDFICCAGCKGFFTKNNIRHHFKQCTKKIVGRTVKVLGRKVQGRIHESANSILRNVVFPILREDDIIRLIRYDELLITYGNKLCIKYKHQHQQDMIRARLRLLGRFLKAIKKINKNVTDFFSIYHPSIYDDCITAVNQVAGYNTSTKVYAAPSVASRIGTLIKQIGNLAIAECIKQNKFQKK
ncbi:GATA zinc finger domain-containing protein 14-like [Monomorium pharaonis]|nr:GATA zinc finger domain-containing protein 14-like [Monomorium pharaonis]